MWTSSPSRSTTTSASKRSSFLFRRKNGQLAREAQPLRRLLFFLEEKKQKKINCGTGILCAAAAFANVVYKTDGSHTNRPFFRSKQDERESVFPRMTSSPAVSFVSFLQEKKSYPFLFFLERKGSKRKSTAGELLLCSPAVFHNVQHKTDGSHTNRPFFRFKLDVRKSVFPPKDTLPRSVFCFFSSRKEIVPPSRKENVPLQPQ